MEEMTPDEKAEVDGIIRYMEPTGELGDRTAIYRLLDGQLSVVYGRAQSLVQMAGVVITVTGFSGRIIADTNDVAQALIIAGVALTTAAAGLAMWMVAPIRWVSSDLARPVEEWILCTIRLRQRKYRYTRMATAVLVAGMVLYVAAIGVMLWNPEAAELHTVR